MFVYLFTVFLSVVRTQNTETCRHKHKHTHTDCRSVNICQVNHKHAKLLAFEKAKTMEKKKMVQTDTKTQTFDKHPTKGIKMQVSRYEHNQQHTFSGAYLRRPERGRGSKNSHIELGVPSTSVRSICFVYSTLQVHLLGN